jgi:prophage maintenance system killer protein
LFSDFSKTLELTAKQSSDEAALGELERSLLELEELRRYWTNFILKRAADTSAFHFVKNPSFPDGNKRVASSCFLLSSAS